MRRWLAMLAAVAVIAVTGTALAMTGADVVAEDETAMETTPEVAATTTTVDEEVEPDEASSDEFETAEVMWEEPERFIPIEPGDHTPPIIEILHPEDGQVYEQGEAVLEGITEPGAEVFSGEHPADVGEDGSWRIVVDLEVGENLITVVAFDASGNHAIDSVTVVFEAPEKPKEEPKKEEPKKEEPKNEEPKKEEPNEEVEWEFSAHQTYGACSESPPYDVFYGTGKPGSLIVVESEYGRRTTEVGQHGEWELEVVFEGAPLGVVFGVHVVDQFDHHQVFEFVHTD